MNPGQATDPLTQFLIPAMLVFGIFYFLVIRPEQSKQKAHKEKLGQIKKNDQIITSGGIHGTVVNVKETTVIVRIDDNVKIEVEKEAITTVKTQPV